MTEQLPVWLNAGVEPPESLKTSGWEPGMKPAAQHMNWLLNRTYNVLKTLQENGDLAQIEQDLMELETKVTQHLDETASLTNIGHTQLSNAIDSTVDTLAATPFAVKQAYDRGSEAFNETSELRAEFLAFKAALTEGFTANQFGDGLITLNSFNVTAGYYNQSLTRLEI